jgi:SAM-dependent methyltransferase
VSVAPQVDPSHYSFGGYSSERRWLSYWHQINETLAFEPQSCLVIGVGDAVVVDALARRVRTCRSIDIDRALGPSVVASVTDLPFADGAFDVVVCCQVLEHVPFEHVPAALDGLHRIARRGLVLSLPRCSRAWSFRVGNLIDRQYSFTVSVPEQRTLEWNGEHYWEIDAKGYPLRRVRKVLERGGTVRNQFRVPGFPYHHFWSIESAGTSRKGH